MTATEFPDDDKPVDSEKGHESHATEEGICPGERGSDTESTPAQESRQNEVSSDTDNQLDDLCRDIQSLERQRRFAMKQVTRGSNAITAFVACNAFAYHAGIEEDAERKKLFDKARKLIKEIDSGEVGDVAEKTLAAGGERGIVTESRCAAQDDSGDGAVCDADEDAVSGIVRVSSISRKHWDNYEASLVAAMKKLAGQLRVAPWLSTPECKGISLGMLATIVGEAGNLSNYPNPAKLWKRLFGAPVTKKGKTMMPSRWRLEGGLTAEDWEEVGYSPQRHATQQQLKENITRQNGTGPYRQRYDEAKRRTLETHPDWWKDCCKCKGTGTVNEETCPACKGLRKTSLHAHRHAQLLAAKRFVRDLWNRWNEGGLDIEQAITPTDSV